MYTTAEDLRKFWRALNGFRIVTESTTRTMLTPKTRINDSLEYGYGVYLGSHESKSTHYIVGGDAGVGFNSRCFPDEDVVISILSNRTDGEVEVREAVYDALAAELGNQSEELS